MRTISIRELHAKTGAWVRRTEEEREIVVTDRGRAVAVLHPCPSPTAPGATWKNRPLHRAYAALLKAGRLESKLDSTETVSQERDAWR